MYMYIIIVAEQHACSHIQQCFEHLQGYLAHKIPTRGCRRLRVQGLFEIRSTKL